MVKCLEKGLERLEQWDLNAQTKMSVLVAYLNRQKPFRAKLTNFALYRSDDGLNYRQAVANENLGAFAIVYDIDKELTYHVLNHLHKIQLPERTWRDWVPCSAWLCGVEENLEHLLVQKQANSTNFFNTQKIARVFDQEVMQILAKDTVKETVNNAIKSQADHLLVAKLVNNVNLAVQKDKQAGSKQEYLVFDADKAKLSFFTSLTKYYDIFRKLFNFKEANFNLLVKADLGFIYFYVSFSAEANLKSGKTFSLSDKTIDLINIHQKQRQLEHKKSTKDLTKVDDKVADAQKVEIKLNKPAEDKKQEAEAAKKQAEAKKKAKAKKQAEAESKKEAEAKSKKQAEAEAEAEAKKQTEAEVEAKKKTEAEAEAEKRAAPGKLNKQKSRGKLNKQKSKRNKK